MLEGIKVLDLTRVLAGPYCTMLLASMGAEVIKVEPVTGEEGRTYGPPFVKGQSALFLSANRCKKSLALDFLNQTGRQILNRLIALSDVVVQNFRPDFIRKAGLGFDDVAKINSSVIYCGITGYGDESDYRNKPVSDSIIQGASAFMFSSGEEGDQPIRCGAAVIDIPTGIVAALAILGALYERIKTGGPKKLSITLFDVSLNMQLNRWAEFIAESKNPPRELNPRLVVPARHFKTRDGTYITISAVNDKFFREICRVLNRSELAENPKFKRQEMRVENRLELIPIFEQIFEKLDLAEITARLDSVDVPWSVVRDYEEVYSDPILRQRFKENLHPKIGQWIFPPLPFDLAGGKFANRPAPMLGENTRQILKEIGYKDDYISKLSQEGNILIADE